MEKKVNRAEGFERKRKSEKNQKENLNIWKKTVAVIHSTTIGKNKKNKENIDIILLIKPPAEHGKIGNISREFGKD